MAKIIPFEAQYAQQCEELITRSIQSVDSLDQRTKDYMVQWYSAKNLVLKAQQYPFFVILEDTTPVGIGALKGEEILKFYIDADRQGMGYGRQLLEHIKDVAWNQGLEKVIAYAIGNSQPLLSNDGWEEVKPYTWPNNGYPLETTLMKIANPRSESQ